MRVQAAGIKKGPSKDGPLQLCQAFARESDRALGSSPILYHLFDPALELTGALAQLGGRGRKKISIETATLFDGADCVGAQPELNRLTKNVAQHRGLLQIRQKPAACSVLCVTYIISGLNTFAGEVATTSHDTIPS